MILVIHVYILQISHSMFFMFLLLQQSMFPNNQCKPKLNKRVATNSSTKISRIKDSIHNHDSKSSRKSPPYKNISASKLPRTYHKQISGNSKSKQKDRQTKIIHQQYYIQQKKTDKEKKNNQIERKKISTNKFGECNQNRIISNAKETNLNMDCFQINNKVSFPQCSNVITFQGKVIKLPPKGVRSAANINYTSISGYQEEGTQDQYINGMTVKTKKKSKQQKSSSGAFKQGLKQKGKKSGKHCRSQQYLTYEEPRYNKFEQQLGLLGIKCEIGQETQISPIRKPQYQRNQKFDYEQIYELINEDLKACDLHQIKVNKDNVKQRKQCMQFLSQICGELALRRETFYLAISIFDRACSKKMTIDNYKLLALVSLTLSMKLEQASLSQQFVHVLGIVNSDRQSYLESISSCKSSSKPKSIAQLSGSKKSSISKSQNKKWKPTKISIKQQDICRISIGCVAKLMKKYGCSKILKKQFMDLQQKVTIYLRFRLWRIQAIFWADLLTCMWDQHILSIQCPPTYSLLFRSSSYLKSINYLYQILEMSYLNENVYNFPSIHIVLSTMYLLVRIAKESKQGNQVIDKEKDKNREINELYQFYKQSLSSSTNILFVDRTGINQIYWIFLEKLKIQMVDLLGCCQFISQFLDPKLLKYQMNSENGKESIDAGLSIHEFYPSIY